MTVFLYILIKEEAFMFTNFALVGTVKELPVITSDANGLVSAYVTVVCERAFPDMDGIYHTDTFRVSLWKGIAEQCADACRIGSVIGFKGRIECIEKKDDPDGMLYQPQLIAERVRIIRV
jgi:single-strand DNA-binding protein